jgi:PTH1 family peptidyl-tRNA hydrolase
MIELVAFLGNPGREYSRNRHNAGRLLAERLPFYGGLGWQKKYKGLYAVYEGAPLERRVHFIMPETYMNLSGESVLAAASFFKIKADAILIVHDELELAPGFASFKFSGGLGGHNGLRSMKASFGTADFWRLRIGIGRPGSRLPGQGGNPAKNSDDIAGWVLSDFSAGEMDILSPVLDAGALALVQALQGKPEDMLPEWNKKKIEVKAAAGEM